MVRDVDDEELEFHDRLRVFRWNMLIEVVLRFNLELVRELYPIF